MLLQHFREISTTGDPALIEAVGEHAPNPDGYLGVFFTHPAASRQSGMETLGRLTTRTEDRDKPTT